jgi:hypothetical protein
MVYGSQFLQVLHLPLEVYLMPQLRPEPRKELKRQPSLLHASKIDAISPFLFIIQQFYQQNRQYINTQQATL